MRCSISADFRKGTTWRTSLLLAAAAWAISLYAAQAQTGLSGIVRIEEDWELVVNTPETFDTSPQVTCVIAPATLDDGYMALDLNYDTQPDYAPGGVQMHVWSPDTPMKVADSGLTDMLATPGETITWTTRMTLNPGNALKFDVVNANSQTWGDFAADNKLSITVNTSATDLATYSPAVSLDNSGVPYASNLVDSLTLKAVRWYVAGSNNPVYQITTPQAVHPQE